MYEQPYNPYLHNVNVVKDYFKSKLVLALAILSAASIVLTVISSLVSVDLVNDAISQFAAYFDANILDSGNEALVSISQALHEATANSGVWSALGSVSIGSLISTIAFFLIYFKSNSEKPESTPKAGVTILSVLAILALIGSILLSLVLALAAAALFILYAEVKSNSNLSFSFDVMEEQVYFDDTVLLVLAITMTVVAVIMIFFMLFYTINRVRYLGSIRKSMTTVELSRSGAKPFGVLLMIGAICTGLNLITSVPSLFSANSALESVGIRLTVDTTLPAVVSLISQAVAFAAMFIQAKIALGYAKYIDDKKYGYSEPPVSEPYTPANVGVGSRSQPNPYTYLAQPKTDSSDGASFTNPYLDPYEETVTPAKTTCPNCGAKVDGNAPFCGQCGTKM